MTLQNLDRSISTFNVRLIDKQNFHDKSLVYFKKPLISF